MSGVRTRESGLGSQESGLGSQESGVGSREIEKLPVIQLLQYADSIVQYATVQSHSILQDM